MRAITQAKSDEHPKKKKKIDLVIIPETPHMRCTSLRPTGIVLLRRSKVEGHTSATKNVDNTGGHDMKKDYLISIYILTELFLFLLFVCAPKNHIKIIVSNSFSSYGSR